VLGLNPTVHELSGQAEDQRAGPPFIGKQIDTHEFTVVKGSPHRFSCVAQTKKHFFENLYFLLMPFPVQRINYFFLKQMPTDRAHIKLH